MERFITFLYTYGVYITVDNNVLPIVGVLKSHDYNDLLIVGLCKSYDNNVFLIVGLPKGAMLTHKGTMATIVAAAAILVRNLFKNSFTTLTTLLIATIDHSYRISCTPMSNGEIKGEWISFLL